jgi:hypothetical protein
MYHYNPLTALEELTEDATLPNPVHVRDMMLRRKLTADQSLELNRIFIEYQKFFGEAQKLGKEILKRWATGDPGFLTWVLNPQIPHLQSVYRFFYGVTLNTVP